MGRKAMHERAALAGKNKLRIMSYATPLLNSEGMPLYALHRYVRP